MHCSETSGVFNEESLAFQRKIYTRAGLGDATYFPISVINEHKKKRQIDMQHSMKEAEQVMFSALNELFDKTKIKPKDVGILVVKCSLFNPTPSLASMIINQ